MADKTITGIVTWLKGWFYDKDEITTKENALQTQINNKASQSDLNTLSSTVSGKADSVHTHSSTDVTEDSALGNIGTSANASQHTINQSIDNIIGNLISADIIKVVTTLPTASASTMNALYLLRSNSQYDIYITVESSGSYAWEKLDDDVLSDLSIDWSDINGKPTYFPPTNHSHGHITYDGKINTSVSIASDDMILITDASMDSKVSKVSNILSTHMKHSSALANIGTSANATQSTINTNIDTKLGAKAEKSEVIDWDSLTFVAKADDETGAITFDYLE